MNDKLNNENIKNTIKIVELGCGPYKTKNAIGIDILNVPGVDIVADIGKGLPFFEDSSIDVIITNHTLEHIENIEFLIKEIHRVLKKDGKAQIRVPHFSNPYYYSDHTHRRFFGLYSFDYFTDPEFQLKRKVPAFYNDTRFIIIKRKLVFKSNFFIRNLIKKYILQPIFNSSSYIMEYYEECLCYTFPCTEIYFEIRPMK